MKRRTPSPEGPLDRLRWPIRLTWLGLLAERIVRSFWPLWTVVFALVAVAAFRLQDYVPVEIAWAGLLAGIAVFVGGLWTGLGRFRIPTLDEVLDRLDSRLPGRPIAALRDRQAIGVDDPESTQIWQAHQARMADRAAKAKAVEPDLRLSRQDPFALRYVALLGLILALGFGSIWQVAGFSPLPGGAAVAAGPAWEGWIKPPLYTGKPTIYLSDIKTDDLSVPQGSAVTLRLYGKVGALTVAETVSGRTGKIAPAFAADQSFPITRSGELTINGRGGRSWSVSVIPDEKPAVRILDRPQRQANGEMRLPFRATDDYGVVKGKAVIALDLAKIDRRYGLAAAPEPRAPIVLDLPMPINGKRSDFNGVLSDNLQKNAWANLPVTITLTVTDAAGQQSDPASMEVDLPGKRFFDPLAAAVIEMRRDLLWSRANGERTDEILRAITWQPQGFIKNQSAYLLLRVAMRRLEAGIAAPGGLTVAVRDEVAEALWQVAITLERGTLSDALDRLKQAQDKLSEAIRRGASKDEIAKLMDDLNQALRNYVARLAEQQQGKDQQTAQNQNTQTITGDQMQQMLNRLQQLMEQGKMAEAQRLLDALRNLTQNMRVAQGAGGMQVPGSNAMKGLSDTLRKQQGLSDKTFQDLQNRFAQQLGQQPGGQGQPGAEGQNGSTGAQGEGSQGNGGQTPTPGAGPGPRQGQGQGTGPGDLAQQQQALRQELNRQLQGLLPGDGTAEGRAARDALDRAGRAMDQAAQDLQSGDNAHALDQQAQALDALRKGLHSMDQAMAKGLPDGPQQSGQADGAGRGGQSDPLGRQVGDAGAIGTQQNLLQGPDVYRRAQQLLDELRKRSGDLSRPQIERDYLRRLLQLF